MRVGIRADGGPELGIGHLVRSSVLANLFLEEGHDVTYLTKTPEYVAEVCPSTVDIYSIDSRHPHEDTVAWIDETDTEIVVSDSYEVDTAAQEAIAGATDCFVVLQHDDRHELYCDILVNGNIYAPNIVYRWRGQEPTWCVGLDYLLLRDEFRELADCPPNCRESPETALITIGGSDVTNTTPDVIRAFDGLDLEVEVIIGPGYDNEIQIENAASQTSCEFHMIREPRNLPTRMASVDLAVSGFGTTAYELLAAGTPFVGIPVVNNQKRTARAFKEQGLVEIANRECELKEKIRLLVNGFDKRRAFTEKYNSMLDGMGVDRVFEEISFQLYSRQG